MKHTLASTSLAWTNVQSPQPQELAEFIRETGIGAADAEFITAQFQRPRVIVNPDYLILLIHIPVFDRKIRLTKGIALFFIVTPKHLYSLHYEPLVQLDKIRMDLTADTAGLNSLLIDDPLSSCLDIISILYEGAFRKLDRLAKHIEIAEDAIFQGNERKMVEEISLLTRDVMDFRKVIRPQKNLIRSAPAHKLITDDSAHKLVWVRGQLLKMWEILESMFESVRELSRTNFSLIQHKQNDLLRILTVYSIIVIPVLSFVGPVFNPGSPTASPTDTIIAWSILGLLLLILVVLLVNARHRRLL